MRICDRHNIARLQEGVILGVLTACEWTTCDGDRTIRSTTRLCFDCRVRHVSCCTGVGRVSLDTDPSETNARNCCRNCCKVIGSYSDPIWTINGGTTCKTKAGTSVYKRECSSCYLRLCLCMTSCVYHVCCSLR